MEQMDKTKLIISLRNIIRVLGITKEELFGASTIPVSAVKEPELKPTPSNDDVDDDFMDNKNVDIEGFLKRHPDSLIKLQPENSSEPVSPTSTATDSDNEVDPSIVDDDFGGKR
jgi:hypothetical protein